MNKTVCVSATIMLMVGLYNAAGAQDRSLLNAQLPTGEIGQTQIMRRPELANVWQPVLVRIPNGATLWFAEGAGFSSGQADAQLVSLQVGSTYRLKVSNIPFNYGDVYPTIELIDRMHAPPGKETRYPVPVEITAEDLTMALSGKFVTRVVYVEDPRNAVGGRELPEQRYFEALPSEDPYEVASRIGRPIAILRMGSVVPKSSGSAAEFLFGSPPIQRHALWPKTPTYEPSELEPSDLPAEPEKLAPLPDAPETPEAIEQLPEVPEDLPAKKDEVEEPNNPVADEPDLFEDAPEEPTDAAEPAEDFGDDPFDAPDTESDDDPFADFE